MKYLFARAFNCVIIGRQQTQPPPNIMKPSKKALRAFASRYSFEVWSRLCADAEFERLVNEGKFEDARDRADEIR